MIRLYDLAGARDDCRFSPNCWPVRMALLHKGLTFETVPWRFTEKKAIAFSGQGLVPVLVDGERIVFEKWAIAEYLEDTYPDRPSLFGGPEGRALAHFVTNWTVATISGGAIRLILSDIFSVIHEKDRAYFRESREKRFGMTLEEVTKDRDGRVEEFRKSLQPMRVSLARSPFLSGDAPGWADYVAFGPFQWARSVSRFPLLKADDPVFAWRERMICLFDHEADKVQSTCSQRVRFVLNAKGLSFDEVKLDLLAGDQLKPDYLALNPNGVVPTLDHDGKIIIDSSVIIEYLDEVFPDRESFTPKDAATRAHMRALMRFIDEMPAAAVRIPTFNLAFLPRFAAMSETEFQAFAESKPLRKEFMLQMGRTGFPQKDMDAALGRLRRTYERMDDEIEKSGGPWLLGPEPSLADVALMPAIVRMADLGRESDWADLPRVQRWYDAIRAHKAFKPTYYPGSLLTERFPHLRQKH